MSRKRPRRRRHPSSSTTSARPRAVFTPHFEQLETRNLLAVTASFAPASGVLSILGDNIGNSIDISRNAAGSILVNGGAVAVTGGTPTVANTTLIQAFGLGGDDAISLNEVSGALPRANLYGGPGADVLTGGSGGDLLFGQSGQDTLLSRGGADLLFGGSDPDVLTGGDADDQAFGQSGADRMIWNPGDDTDLNEGGADVDSVEVNGGNGTEVFTATANGTRVRFDRISPAPFAIDIGTSEKLTLNANGGDDDFSATGNLAALIQITVDGGAGNDNLRGSNGADTLLGGDGNDVLDGNQGDDVALMGAGDDVFQWDPGDGSDVVEGQADVDAMLFNGSAANEVMDVAPNGQRVRFTRNIGSIVMDLGGVEQINVNLLGGADTLTVNSLIGTPITALNISLAGAIGGATGDGAVDSIFVVGTTAEDIVMVSGSAGATTLSGLSAVVTIVAAEPANDRLTVNLLAGDDVLDASALAATGISLAVDGGDNDDALTGGEGPDVLSGGLGDDVLIGGPGVDTLDGGPGDNVILQ